MNLDRFLDLDQWDESRGFGSVHGPICPYCEQSLPRSACGAHGIAECTHCHRRLAWQLLSTPLGQAWQTWRRLPQH